MHVFFEETYTIGTRDTDVFNQCRPSALLGILQEAATSAACELQVAREAMMSRYNAFWMLARIWYRLERPLCWNERVTVRTWHRGGRGATMYRDFDLSVKGVPVGEAVSLWVLAGQDTHKLMRVSGLPEFEGTSGGALCKDKVLSKLRLPKDMLLAEERLLRYSDTDVNGHVNNSRYADFSCDALKLEQLAAGQFVSSLQLGYLAECLPGERVALYTGQEEGHWYVRGTEVANQEAGTAKGRFEAVLELCPLL